MRSMFRSGYRLAFIQFSLALVFVIPFADAHAQLAIPTGDIYKSRCASCHLDPVHTRGQGTTSRGDVGLILSSKRLDEQAENLRKASTDNPTMPNFYLTDAWVDDGQIISIHAYLKAVRDAVVTASLDAFNDTLVGASSSTQSISIANLRGVSINYRLSVTGADREDFSVSQSPACAIDAATGRVAGAASTSSSSSCTVEVQFHPKLTSDRDYSDRQAALVVTFERNLECVPADNSKCDPVPPTRNIVLKGKALAPKIFVPTLPLAFNAYANFNSDVRCIKVSNIGNAKLTLTAIDLVQPTPAFSEYVPVNSNFCPSEPGLPTCTGGSELSAEPEGSSCQLAIRFTPKLEGSRTGSVSIAHTDPRISSSPVAISLNGTASKTPVPSISVIPERIDFGERALDSSEVLQDLKITNSSALVAIEWPIDKRFLIVDDITGRESAEFVPQPGDCTAAVLGTLAFCTMKVSFKPTGQAGDRKATLRIFTKASVTPLKTVPLTGRGSIAPEPKVPVAAVFDDTVVGLENPSPVHVVIENPRTNSALTYTIGLGGPDGADFVVAANPCNGRINPKSSCSITLAFKPRVAAGVRARTATLDLTFAGTGGDPSPNPALRRVALSGNAIGPLTVPSSLELTAQVTLDKTGQLQLTNRGLLPIRLAAFTLEGAFASEYSLAPGSQCTTGFTLLSGTSCALVIRFSPLGAGSARDATLKVVHDAAGSPQSISLRGTATPAPQGLLIASATSLAYADTQVGSSRSQSLTLSNAGDAALTFNSFDLSGSAAGDFERTGDCSTAVALQKDKTCTLTIAFRPRAVGARQATLTIRSNGSNPTVVIALNGNGIPVPVPQASLVPETPGTPAVLAFGEQTVGGLYLPRKVRLSNSGTANMHVASVAVQGVAFALANPAACPTVLGPDEGCDIEVRFVPTGAATDFEGRLTVTTNAPGSPHVMPLRGRGVATAVPVLVWFPVVTQLDFGSVQAGTVSPVKSATLLNRGPGGVTLSVLNAVGPGAASFSVADGSCRPGQTLYEGQTCGVDVRFAPTGAGGRSATIQVASSGSFPPVLALTGTGLGSSTVLLGLSQTTVTFPAVRVGAQSTPSELRISSMGSGNLTVTALAVDGPYVVQSRSCPAVPFTLGAGSECALSLMFRPQSAGHFQGVLRINTDAEPPTREVALRGDAQAAADVSSGGGGCSIASGRTLFDPTLWLLVLVAGCGLWWRRHDKPVRQRRP